MKEANELIHMLQCVIQTGISYTQWRNNNYDHPTMIEAFTDLFSPVMVKEA